jgi:hypothetical protein
VASWCSSALLMLLIALDPVENRSLSTDDCVLVISISSSYVGGGGSLIRFSPGNPTNLTENYRKLLHFLQANVKIVKVKVKMSLYLTN